MTNSAISFHHVYRRFASKEVLKGLSFDVQPGQVYALLGRNGAGKTTALRLAMGFLSPHHGTCYVLGQDSRNLSPKDRGRIGYVAEGHKLYQTMTAEGIMEFEKATRPQFDKEYAMAAVKRCNLPTNRAMLRLSRGQRAQVALIAAASSRPELLVFDDPAMGLDVVMRREFLDVMIDLLADQGASVLFSSHILTDVERMADRIGIIHDGHMLVDATMDDIKRRIVRCSWRATQGSSALPPDVPGTLRCRRRRNMFELTMLDLDEAKVLQLKSGGAHVEIGQAPSLEDLFLDLVTRNEATAAHQSLSLEGVSC